MSWSASITAAPREEISTRLKEFLDKQLEVQPFDSWDDSVQAQQDEAREIAQALSERVRGSKINVSIAGHRVPPGQTGSDSIGISVSSGEYVGPAKS